MFPRLTACIVFFRLLLSGAGAPVETTSVNPSTETLDCNNENSDVYDQRQNGTENYRIHVNGVVVLVAPAETVLQAAQLGSLQLGTEPETNTSATQVLKPKPKPPTVTDKVPYENPVKETPVMHPKDSKEWVDRVELKSDKSIRHDTEGTLHHTNK